MEKKINYAMVGMFVIVLAATWLAISLWLALGDIYTQYNTYLCTPLSLCPEN